MDDYQRFGPALVRKAERMLQNRDDALDLVQSLFVDMLEQPATPRDLPYLYRAITRRCLNHLRDGKNRARLLREHDGSLRGEVAVRCDDHVIELDLLAKLCERLDQDTAEVLIYRYFDEMLQDEIAEITGTSRKTVGKRLERVRHAVTTLLSTANPNAHGAHDAHDPSEAP